LIDKARGKFVDDGRGRVNGARGVDRRRCSVGISGVQQRRGSGNGLVEASDHGASLVSNSDRVCSIRNGLKHLL
jgi:hypothetical protein